ncbi:unnamed protein product [Rotaria sordida]|uniref:F-box domain-containing protein n=1 Tax=Rotaria sordida TaxID=392033 RepID=A0A819CLZ7_9BILA|nr:unnamed protein product [Rotaria sordida]
MSFTQIEDLSNEIFFEIFDYIEYNDLFNAFLNLNNRFQNLLNYPFLRLKLHIDHQPEFAVQKYYTEFVIPNKYRIVSLYLHDQLDIISQSSLDNNNSSFSRLESLVLNQVQCQKLISIFPILTSLPRLFSITINFIDNTIDLTEIYRLIFLLPYLKKVELSARRNSLMISLPMNTYEHYSSIKHLIIKHVCYVEELIVLLPYTPRLTHLTCIELSKQYQDIERMQSIMMENLTSITLNICDVQFDEFEIFIKKICKQLRILSIDKIQDIAYLNANRWEQLICKYMPYLHIFKFEYDEHYYQPIEWSSYHSQLNQFTSSFWINRGWFFQITADIDYWPPIKISYSICTDMTKYSTMYEQIVPMKLELIHFYFAPSRQDLIDTTLHFFTNLHLNRVDVDCKKLSYNKFIQLLHMLPNLNALKILSLSSFNINRLSQEQIESIQLWSRTNQITKLILENFIDQNDFEKIQFFINLVPQIEYLQVKCEKNFNIELIVQHILFKTIDKFLNFNLLCLYVKIANDIMIKQLQIMIDREKLLHNYQITRSTDRIYLQWKLK